MSKIPNKRTIPSPSKVVLRPGRIAGNSQTINSNARKSLNIPSLKIGDRVIVNDKSGTIAFIGSTKFSDGEWIGINLDEPLGKNDGSYNGIRYFETDPNHGLFCRRDAVKHLSINVIPQRHSVHNPLKFSTTESASNNILGITTIGKLDLSSTKNLQIGDRVIIHGEKYGTLKYIGKIHINEGIWCGIKLDGPFGKHDGKIEGKRYFQCSHRHGVFAPLHHVEKVISDINDPQTFPRESFISIDSNNQYHDSNSPSSHLSEFSTSSNETNHFPSRSPKKIKQPILTTNLTLLSSSSSELTNLLETIKEKDLIIGNLQTQHEKDRLELQRKYELKENENKNLRKQYIELTQRFEDLQFQFESHQNQIIIPDNYCLLNPDEIKTYQQTKENILQLELINKNLLEEKQTFLEKLKQYNEFQKQIELLQLQITDLKTQEQIKTKQFTEKETFYQQQINDYQSKIEQIIEKEQNVQSRLRTLEEEKQINEQQINDLLDELKQHKENIIPNLENQCEMLKLELQIRDQTVNMTMNEREIYYEEQIKEYQENINQAKYETEKIRIELQKIQEENHRKEKQINTLINQLKENNEKLQLTINDQEHQYESEYEKQIKEYENNLNQTINTTENIQLQLNKFDEEKLLYDNKLNTTINLINEQYEKKFETLINQNEKENQFLKEHIARYEIEIKEYQMKIDQSTHEIENLHDKLKSLEEEKLAQEEKLNQTIETLKIDCQELQIEIDELNEREHNARKTLHQYDAQFDQQIRQYQEKLEQTDLENQHLHSELEKLQEEKTHFNDTVNTLAQDLEILKNELQDRDQTDNMTLNELETHYKSEINEHQARTAQALLEMQDLQSKLTNLQQEKAIMEEQLNKTIETLKHDYEKRQNEGELKVVKDLHQRDLQITEYQEKLEQTNLDIQYLQSNLEKLQTESNNTIHSLSQDLETLKNELQDQERVHIEREEKYKSEINEHKTTIDQALLEIQHLHSKLTNLQQEKTTNEEKLKQNYEKIQNEGINQAQQDLHQRDLQITEYQEKLEQANLDIQYLQSELEKLQTESNNTIRSLSQDLETLKNELQDQVGTYHEHEDQYKSEINEQKLRIDQALLEIQHLQSKLTNLEQEKITNEDNLNKIINTLQQENEKLQNDQKQKEEILSKKIRSQYEQEIDEYQKSLELSIYKVEDIESQLINLQEEKESNEKLLNDEINSLKTNYENQIQILKTQILDLKKQDENKEKQLKRYQLEYDQTNELNQRIENLKLINKTLQTELDDIKNQHNPEEIEQLSQKLHELQQMHTNLLEKQANREREYIEEKKVQEKTFKEKIDEYDMKMRLLQNELVVEMENAKLDHEQEILRLKSLIPKQAPAPPTKGKK